jgi:hypothetical protein
VQSIALHRRDRRFKSAAVGALAALLVLAGVAMILTGD